MLGPDAIGLIVNWLPIAVFVVLWLAYSRSSRRRLDKYDRHYAELIAINKEMAASLAEIRMLLEPGRP